MPLDRTQVDREGPKLADARIPVDLLLSPAGSEILDVVLTEVGARVVSATPTQVRYIPERSIIVQYKTRVAWGDRESSEILVAASGLGVPDSTPLVEVDQTQVAIWRYPRDPFLPGLEAAADPKRVNNLLTDLGSPQSHTKLRRRAYRPGRRAVIEVVSPSARVFLKVVRPDQIAELQAKHVALVDHVPVPHSYGWSHDLGLIALQAMAGKTLRRLLESGSRLLPDPAQILHLLDGMPMPMVFDTHVKGPIASARRHAKLLKTITPESAEKVDEIVETISRAEDEAEGPVHGDFHSSQILVRGSDIAGLVDVDTAGVGQRANDLAGLLGHLATLALTSSKRRTMTDYTEGLITIFDKQTNPRGLRLRTAGVILGLATGPFRVQNPSWPPETARRIDLAKRWTDSAESL